MLMNYLGFATWLSIGAAVFCLPYLRWKCPDLPRPIKVSREHRRRIYTEEKAKVVAAVWGQN